MRYAVVIEKGERNYWAYVPDLPGCVSVGDTLEEAKAEIREAIEFHLEGMRRTARRSRRRRVGRSMWRWRKRPRRDASRTGDCFQGISGNRLLKAGQTPRRLGYDFEATGRGVKGLIVGKEGVEVEAVNKAHRAGDVVPYVLQRVAFGVRKHRSRRRPRGVEGAAFKASLSITSTEL